MARGALYTLLQNPIYRGQVRHKGEIYPGLHDAIIDEALWEAVQVKLEENRIAEERKLFAREPALLAGVVFAEDSVRFTPMHASKGRRRYRYYVEQGGQERSRRRRLPAGDLEHLVVEGVAAFLRDGSRLRQALEARGVGVLEMEDCRARADLLARDLRSEEPAAQRDHLHELLERVIIKGAALELLIRSQVLTRLDTEAAGDDCIAISIPATLRRAGLEVRLVDETAAHPDPDAVLIRLIGTAWAHREKILRADGRSVDAVIPGGGARISKTLQLGFLAPDIIEAILAGDRKIGVTAHSLTHLKELPVDWAEQRRLILGG